MTTGGSWTVTPLLFSSQVSSITTGPDGAIWFADLVGNRIGRLTTGAVAKPAALSLSPSVGPAGTVIHVGGDGLSGASAVTRRRRAGVVPRSRRRPRRHRAVGDRRRARGGHHPSRPLGADGRDDFHVHDVRARSVGAAAGGRCADRRPRVSHARERRVADRSRSARPRPHRSTSPPRCRLRARALRSAQAVEPSS